MNPYIMTTVILIFLVALITFPFGLSLEGKATKGKDHMRK